MQRNQNSKTQTEVETVLSRQSKITVSQKQSENRVNKPQEIRFEKQKLNQSGSPRAPLSPKKPFLDIAGKADL